MTERVFVSNLCLHGRHGVFPEEAKLGQKFYLDIVCDFDGEEAIRDDDYRKSVNYATLCELAAAVSKGGPYKLIETLGDRIAKAVLERYAQVSRVVVRVRKPSAPIAFALDTVGVEIGRERRAEVGLSLGSNVGDKVANIRAAIARLAGEPDVRVEKMSRLYRTAPWGKTDQDWFVNAAAVVVTSSSPRNLLSRLKSLEIQLGRTPTERWGPRVIDIDMLYWDDRTLASDELTLPHVDMFSRGFVMIPLGEIVPERVIAGRKVGEVAERFRGEGADVVLLEEGG
jgi:dihydroneopterin aldolase/2-amino-4-hydroxy-6-hydroxymethyldihydropteridine diphosphokinase